MVFVDLGCHNIVGYLTRLLVVRCASSEADSWKLGDRSILTESRCDHSQSETGKGFDDKGFCRRVCISGRRSISVLALFEKDSA